MNFTFTKENVELYWKILNTSQSKDEKKMADEYLIAFKVSCKQLEIILIYTFLLTIFYYKIYT